MSEDALDIVLRLTVPAGRQLLRLMARDIRRAILATAALDETAVMRAVKAAVVRHLPNVGRAFGDAMLAAWVMAARQPADSLFDEPRRPGRRPGQPVSRYRFAEEAIDWLQTRGVFPEAEIDATRRQHERQGLILAHVVGEMAMESVRGQLADAIANGSDVVAFVRKNKDVLGLDERELRTFYRTNLGIAQAEGQKRVLSVPLVGNEFPYVLYTAVHDSRVRDDHILLESLGLNGTPVYRREDPVILKFWPPWSWNCRCLVVPLSAEDAAARGVKEAQRWVRTGRPPENPEYVTHPPFDLPRGWLSV
jgi:hypothetical protein